MEDGILLLLARYIQSGLEAYVSAYKDDPAELAWVIGGFEASFPWKAVSIARFAFDGPYVDEIMEERDDGLPF